MSKYLRYVVKNIGPLRIVDSSASQTGHSMTLRYIPGTAVRGLLIHSLSKDSGFGQMKKTLFSDQIRYLDAYPSIGGKELIPSPKGFYEDKTQGGRKKIKNVVTDGEFEEGFKRASVGDYCYIEDGCIHYYQVKTGSDMKIKMNIGENEKKNVFRNEYIMPGYRFTGYIAADGEAEALLGRMKNILDGQIYLGNGRSAGMGKCIVESCGYADAPPHMEYQADHALPGGCYMMLLSNTAMRDGNGSYCGLDLKALERKMGVSGMRIEFCSTSMVETKGFNSTWMGHTPSLPMYGQGSVFHLSYSGELEPGRARSLMDQGIGVRRNEGAGRILFMKDYEQVIFKQEGVQDYGKRKNEGNDKPTDEDMETLKIAAHGYYRQKIGRAVNQYVVDGVFKKGRMAPNHLGQIASIAETYQYDPEQGISTIKAYLENMRKKEGAQNIHKAKNRTDLLTESVLGILDNSLEETLRIKTKDRGTVMGIPKDEVLGAREAGSIKLQLLLSLARYENKLEKEGE